MDGRVSIAEEDRKRIWDQFYRAEARTSKAGTGLGLSIAKEILELHHAAYGVDNTQDGVSRSLILGQATTQIFRGAMIKSGLCY